MKWLEKAATLELKSKRQNKSIGRNKCDHVAGFWAPEGCSLGIETHRHYHTILKSLRHLAEINTN